MVSLVRMYVAIGLRTNMFKILMVVAVLLVFCAWLASGMSARQPTSLMLDFGFSVLRLSLCLMALMWLQELLGKAIEKRYISQVLAYPLAKYQVLLANYIAVALLLLLSLIAVAMVLLAAAHFGSFYEQTTPPNVGAAYVLTWALIYLDLLVVLAFALLMTAISTTPQLPLIFGLGFFVITHALGPILDYLLLADTAEELHKQTISPVLAKLRYIVPELSRLDVRELSLYNEAIQASYIIKQAVFGICYAVFLLALAVICFQRREFQ